MRTRAPQIIQAWGFVPYLRVSVTGLCNADCGFCHNEGNGRTNSKLSSDDYRNIARDARAAGLKTVKFTGGEPTLRRDLEDLIRVFVEEGFDDISMVSNGVLLTPGRLISLQEAGLNRVAVSLHSLVPARYASLFRCKPETLERVLENLGAAARIFSGRVKINVMFSRGTNFPEELVPLLNYCGSHGFTLSVLGLVSLPQLCILEELRTIAHEAVGIESVTHLAKRGVEFTILHLANGAIVELDDFRQENAKQRKISNPYCSKCPLLGLCVEGPYAFRIKVDGTFKPCLIRTDNEIARPLPAAAAAPC